MLKNPFRVTSSVKGLDPDVKLEKGGQQLEAWFSRNKGSKLRKLTAEHRKKLINSAEKARRAKQKKQHLAMDKATKSEGTIPSQLILMEDLSMKNEMMTTTGRETF